MRFINFVWSKHPGSDFGPPNYTPLFEHDTEDDLFVHF